MTRGQEDERLRNASRHGLFRRLRRATSRTPSVPGPIPPAQAEVWLRHDPDDRLRVEHIAEPVWVVELELD